MSNPNVTVTTPTGSMAWVANMANSDIVTPTGTPPHTAEFRFKFDAQRLNVLSLDTVDKSIVFTINHGSIGQLKKRIKINLRHDPNTSGSP
jgi:hypothetical protein